MCTYDLTGVSQLAYSLQTNRGDRSSCRPVSYQGLSMTFSRRLLTILVLVVSGLMAVSEAPELLTLSDDVSNDCESVEVSRSNLCRDTIKKSTRPIIPAQALFAGPAIVEAVPHNLLSPASVRSTRSLLLLLVTQRK